MENGGSPGTGDNRGPMEAEAASYLREHKIPELLENITAALVFNRPEDPRTFIKEHLERLLRAQSNPTEHRPPLFIDEANARSVFGMLDLTNTGFISHEQYLAAMESLGVSKFNRNPPGAQLNKINRDIFILEANAGLMSAAATYIDK